MKRNVIVGLALVALPWVAVRRLPAQPEGGDRLYEAMARPGGGGFGPAVQSWARARRTMNQRVVKRVDEASNKLDKPGLRFAAVLRQHGQPETAHLVHEYTENGVGKLLSVVDDRVRKDVIAQLRRVEETEKDIHDKTEASARPDAKELLTSVDTYTSLLLDLDAKMKSVLFKGNAGALECAVTVRTVDPSVDDPTKKERPNHQVVYVGELWKDDPAQWQTFDKLSTPTTQKLRAGYYLMWCRTTEGKGPASDGERQRVEVTEAKDVDLLVPRPKGN